MTTEPGSADYWDGMTQPFGRLQWAVDDPRVFDSVKDAIRSHDPTCKSLIHIWCGRNGGVSCPSDLTSCLVCGVTFFNEGVFWNDEADGYVCECCERTYPHGDVWADAPTIHTPFPPLKRRTVGRASTVRRRPRPTGREDQA